MKPLRIIGLMSGTSLDGLDIACVDFEFSNNKINYTLGATTTVEYSPVFKQQLHNALHLSGLELSVLSNKFAMLCAQHINTFIKQHKLTGIDYIASHGHTIFHQPLHNLTLQIGNGAILAAHTGIHCVCDFRTTDVALGGQGAPLVPIGDKLLFNNYDACLNIGGFANVSYSNKTNTIAYDIAPANIVLNQLTARLNLPYDAEGAIAKAHNVDEELLNTLNALPYYTLLPPKSLGVEWVNEIITPLIHHRTDYTTLIATFTEHAAYQIAKAVNEQPHIGTVLATGGGTFNTYMLQRIQAYSLRAIYTFPSVEVVAFKEAIVFALLGYLRVNNMPNALASVTGACKDSCGGAVYLG
ncbi:MAG: anhydro-N-acetylmuramic acid kinase [Bacteroidia bacterium]|nr:anhydro-N-acetylmuramic acid kinase [Bacteroidia bacterium]